MSLKSWNRRSFVSQALIQPDRHKQTCNMNSIMDFSEASHGRKAGQVPPALAESEPVPPQWRLETWDKPMASKLSARTEVC